MWKTKIKLKHKCLFGDNYKEFLNLLKKDKRADYIEIEGRTFVVVEKRTEKEVPGMYMNPELIYIKPVYVDKGGYETWELAAISKLCKSAYREHLKRAEMKILGELGVI